MSLPVNHSDGQEKRTDLLLQMQSSRANGVGLMAGGGHRVAWIRNNLHKKLYFFDADSLSKSKDLSHLKLVVVWLDYCNHKSVARLKALSNARVVFFRGGKQRLLQILKSHLCEV